MGDCKICKEKQIEINRILRAYCKDKKVYRIVIIVQFALLLLLAAFGAEGLILAMDFAQDMIK
nr:hypothetical protein 3 [Legionellales bacterium]